eukprot:GFKZ01008226.1.p1 GENE.GFKZ01008226.1~~GFKZ01008226.1.p1  ORF type:complete len:170 (-),score=25.70 GFKZ01008226.1:1392-1901(-)
MVKRRPGSRKGLTKLTPSSRKSARRRSVRSAKGLTSNAAIVHPLMKSTWDRRKSPAVNLSRLGLASRVNQIRNFRQKAGPEVPVVSLDAMEPELDGVLKQLEAEAARPEKEPKRVVQPGERLALEGLVAKWGSDWEAMSRDLKLNYLQWTPNQLRRKVQNMQRILDRAA